MSKGKAAGSAFLQGEAPKARVVWDGDDLHLIITDAARYEGVLTGPAQEKGKDTRKLFASKGNPVFWGGWRHPSGRYMGVKLNILLSRPISQIETMSTETSKSTGDME